MLLFDIHLDLAMNAMEWNRDLTRPISEIRRREAGWDDKPDRGKGTVCFPEMIRGSVGLCVATLIARHVKPGNPLPGWHSPAQAWAQTQGQLAWYREMERQGHLRCITSAQLLDEHVRLWQEDSGGPIGYVLSLEGADSIVEPRLLQRSYDMGLRIVGPAHYGPGTYARGTHAEGGLGPAGRELLAEMDRLGMILDVTHLSDDGFWEALEMFQGPVWASHSNSRKLVPDQRQFADDQFRALLERGAVIGTALDAWMLVPGWVKGQSNPQNTDVGLRHVADHLEYLCNLAGNTRHAALGTDLDGGFGKEQGPADLDTIAGLQQLVPMLTERGFTRDDVANIFHGNAIRFLKEAWK
ncbi:MULTISPECIES: dipeptidase [Robiginitalea]|uniref:Putative peptidase n=1 Tax=Robiginitalea biformata (strain ATCC BAA-864 / DSM 15991 / KCTC 12146 / HTCC2501) TaxID=313596 RepID=A4CJ12_ROBBH|nr:MULTISPECIES: membrane dipeptidase [Robiginitalea]EAR16920.1 putative peptidase [Robiginitalea biformata HTCC2501]MDC6352876.1 membrane dipeptidase [Robiginitalea sp. PM2]MDC6373957.1 membrane dipeptidase [Robiginitalea sp. SP8]